MIAAMTITDERKEQMAFSDPYTVSTQYIIVNEADTSVKTIEDLAGKKVAVHLGTTGDFLVSDEIADGCLKDTGAEVVQYKNLTEGCLVMVLIVLTILAIVVFLKKLEIDNPTQKGEDSSEGSA